MASTQPKPAQAVSGIIIPDELLKPLAGLIARISRAEDRSTADAATSVYSDDPASRVRLRSQSDAITALHAGLRADVADQAARRKRDLSIIHQATKELLVEKEAHAAACRMISSQHTGLITDTSGAMTPKERQALILHYQSKGAVSGKGRPRKGGKPDLKPSVAMDRQPLMDKIEALLAEKKRIEGGTWTSWAYADSIAKRVAKVSAVRFADAHGLWSIAAALQKHVNRISKTSHQGDVK